jgi:nucleotide-binding universal stress UspA family protein
MHSTSKVPHGLILDEILAEALRNDYDLVVVGAHTTKGS